MVWLLAPLIGLATGAAAILFRVAIGVFQLPWLGTMIEAVAKVARAEPWWVIIMAPAAGGLLVGLMLQFLLTAKRTAAVPDVMEARIDAGRSLTLGQGLLSAIASALSLGVGASAGREGPIVHLGASIAADVCNHLGLPNTVRRTLIASGGGGCRRRLVQHADRRRALRPGDDPWPFRRQKLHTPGACLGYGNHPVTRS